MTFPPEQHFLRDLRISGARGPDEVRNRVAVEPGICDSEGRVRLGAMAMLIDITGGAIAVAAAQPDWIATADLSAHLGRPVTNGSIEVICRPLRVGVGRVVIEASAIDADGLACGRGLMAFARIPGSVMTSEIDGTTGATTDDFMLSGGQPFDESILDRCRFEPVGPGQLRFEKTDYVRNSFGTVNGGVLALAAEAAAVSACGGGQATDLHIHYLEQIGGGPVAVTAEVVRDDSDSRLCQVRIVDKADNRLAAVTDVIVAESS